MQELRSLKQQQPQYSEALQEMGEWAGLGLGFLWLRRKVKRFIVQWQRLRAAAASPAISRYCMFI